MTHLPPNPYLPIPDGVPVITTIDRIPAMVFFGVALAVCLGLVAALVVARYRLRGPGVTQSAPVVSAGGAPIPRRVAGGPR